METQVVRRPLPPIRRPTPRRSRRRRWVVAAVVVAALGIGLLCWAAPWNDPDPTPTAKVVPAAAPDRDPQKPAVAPAPVAQPAEASEPVVIAMPDEEADSTADSAIPTSDDPADYEVDLGDNLTPTDKIALQLLSELNAADGADKPVDGDAARKTHHRAARRSNGRVRQMTRDLPPLGKRKGVLMINSKPPCRILINNADTGLTTPQREIRLSGGRHKITLINREYHIVTHFTVNIHPGKSVRVVRDLTEHIHHRRARRRARH